MHRTMRAVAVVIATLATAGTVYGQTCRGTTAIHSRSPFYAGGGFEYSKMASLLGVSGAAGTDVFFVGASVGSLDFEDLDQSAVVATVLVGGQVAADASRRLMVCPMFNLSNRFGPNHINYSPLDSSLLSVGGGAAVGARLPEIGNLQVVPTVGAFFARARERLTFAEFEEITRTSTLGIVDAGVGFVLGDRFSIVPMLRVPFGGVDDQKSLVLLLTVAFPD